MPALIRPMTPADFEPALELWKATEGMGLNSADTQEQTNRFLDRNPGLSSVADANGRIVGTALCGHDGRRGFIYHLAVALPFRRRGLGRQLVATCLERLGQAGLTRCHIVVYANNEAGRRFWEHLGFNPRAELLICSRLLV